MGDQPLEHRSRASGALSAAGGRAEETDLTPGLQFYEMGLRFAEMPEEARHVLAAFVESGFHFWPDEESTLSSLESLRVPIEPPADPEGGDPS